MWIEFILAFLALLILAWSVLLWSWRSVLYRLWVEPVLRCPVMVIESDDWGPGPELHAQRLGIIAQALARHRDTSGHPAIMSLGVVLAVPDGPAMAHSDSDGYRRLLLDDARCMSVRDRMIEGEQAGVFALQLHGMEHYWPATLLAAAHRDDTVRAWISGDDCPLYETLPPALQSRWIDSLRLPSRPLDAAQIRDAVEEETMVYQRVFGCMPRVVVPPTFIWTQTVEEAWIVAGIEVIITPGKRYTTRDYAGKPAGVEGPIHNGEQAGPGCLYLVRDIYFEPLRGHAPAEALDESRRRIRSGRPALLETHRSNFIGDETEFRNSLEQVETLLSEALRAWPRLRFLAPEGLARIYRDRPPDWCVTAVPAHLHVWLRRLYALPRLRKLAWLSCLVAPAALLSWLTAASAKREGILP